MSIQFLQSDNAKDHLFDLRYLCLLLESCNNHHALTTYNKMALQNEKITIYLKLLDPCYFTYHAWKR